MLRFAWNETQVAVYSLSVPNVLHEKNRILKIDPSQLSASPSRLGVKGCGTQPPNQFVREWYASTRNTAEVRNDGNRYFADFAGR
jgi:hypothetical protein